MKLYVVVQGFNNGYPHDFGISCDYIRKIFSDETKAVDYCLYDCKTMLGNNFGEEYEVSAEILDTNQESLEAFRVYMIPIECTGLGPIPQASLRIEVHELQE